MPRRSAPSHPGGRRYGRNACCHDPRPYTHTAIATAYANKTAAYTLSAAMWDTVSIEARGATHQGRCHHAFADRAADLAVTPILQSFTPTMRRLWAGTFLHDALDDHR